MQTQFTFVFIQLLSRFMYVYAGYCKVVAFAFILAAVTLILAAITHILDRP